MADGTEIEWTDATWNPITGCSVVSPGCTNCYAMKLAGTRLKHHPSRQGLTTDTKAGPVWNGQVRFNEQWLTQPIEWKKPRRIFVCAHGDLFHENVPDEWIDQVFAVMAMAPDHTFQVLTKRSARMREYLTSDDLNHRISAALGMLLDGDWVWKAGKPHRKRIEELIEKLLGHGADCRGDTVYHDDPMPLPNVWIGVSTEDQTRADERIPDLLNTPAALRFVSIEPMIGPVDLTRIAKPGMANLQGNATRYNALFPTIDTYGQRAHKVHETIDWAIVGGENGQRPTHPDWVRAVRDQCAVAGVPFFFKQWGEWAPICEMSEEQTDACYFPAPASNPDARRRLKVPMCVMHTDGNIFEGNDRYSMGAFAAGSRAMTMFCVGKKAAGAMLDGREWREMPE